MGESVSRATFGVNPTISNGRRSNWPRGFVASSLLPGAIVMSVCRAAALNVSITQPVFGMIMTSHTRCRWALLCCCLAALAGPPSRPALAQAPPGPAVQGPPLPAANGAAKAAALILEDFPIDAQLVIDPVRSKLLKTQLPVARIAITDPSVVEVIQYGPDELEFFGRKSGETTMSIWFNAPNAPPRIIRYLVRVEPDQSAQIRAEREYQLLQSRINELFPNSIVQLIPVMDKLIIRGQARDSEEAAQILALIGQNGNNNSNNGFGGNLGPAGGAVATIPGAESLARYNIVNLMDVPGEQHVMLKVRIAELNRTALRELGLDFQILQDHFAIANAVTGGGGNLTAILDDGDLRLFLRAVAGNGNSKILAEPTLIAQSGKTATFLAGGEFAVPTVVGVEGVAAATTQFRGFGTQLSFTPTVIDKDRIRLMVVPSFSTLNAANSVNGIPGLNTRTVTTQVDLREGQWLAIAGLIQDQQAGTSRRLPWIGEVPGLGMLFSHQTMRREETELIVLVSPELVHPLEAHQAPLILPGMDVTEPTDCELYLHQRIEGDPYCQHRGTVWPEYRFGIYRANHEAIRDANRAAKRHVNYQKCQNHYIAGPHGFSD